MISVKCFWETENQVDGWKMEGEFHKLPKIQDFHFLRQFEDYLK